MSFRKAELFRILKEVTHGSQLKIKKAEIEHIIPQNPVPGQWTSISFDDHEKYLHTLGNLTLTFDNQSLSNKVFADKKKILIERSRIKLNNDLLKYDDFNVKAIESRAESMLRSFLLEFLDIQTL